MLSLCVIVFCMSRRCVVIFRLCDVGCLLMCLCYGVYALCAHRFHWVVLCVLFCYFLSFVVLRCMCCLWCVVLLVVVSLVCRACMVCSCCLVFVRVFFVMA